MMEANVFLFRRNQRRQACPERANLNGCPKVF